MALNLLSMTSVEIDLEVLLLDSDRELGDGALGQAAGRGRRRHSRSGSSVKKVGKAKKEPTVGANLDSEIETMKASLAASVEDEETVGRRDEGLKMKIKGKIRPSRRA